jgi:hypothetical protein
VGHTFRPGIFAPGAQQRGTARSAELTRERTKTFYADLIPLVVELRRRDYTLD